MTKAMRWGVSALSIVGLVAFGAFAGCSSDDGSGTPDNDSGVTITDSGVADSHKVDSQTETTPETSSETTTESGSDGDTAETPPPVPDRRVNVLFARPDEPAGGLYACLGAFPSTITDPSTHTASEMISAQGPVGIPNDPTDPSKGFKSGFTHGSVFPLVVNKGDLAASALDLFTVVGYFLDHDPTTATPPSTCKAEWDTAKADTHRWLTIPKGTIKSGDSFMLALVGCNSPAGGSTGECGGATAGDSRAFIAKTVQTTDPATFTGTGTAKFGVQFLNTTQFSPAPTPPTFQDVDVYILPMNAPADPDAGPDADGGSPTPAGTPIPIAGGPAATAGVKFKDFVDPAVGVALAGDPNEAIFLIAPHGTDLTSCTPGAPTCPIIPLPAKPYLAAYKVIGGGFTGNQVIALLGGLADLTGKPPILAFMPSKF
jgi:hypothetical protein